MRPDIRAVECWIKICVKLSVNNKYLFYKINKISDQFIVEAELEKENVERRKPLRKIASCLWQPILWHPTSTPPVLRELYKRKTSSTFTWKKKSLEIYNKKFSNISKLRISWILQYSGIARVRYIHKGRTWLIQNLVG